MILIFACGKSNSMQALFIMHARIHTHTPKHSWFEHFRTTHTHLSHFNGIVTVKQTANWNRWVRFSSLNSMCRLTNTASTAQFTFRMETSICVTMRLAVQILFMSLPIFFDLLSLYPPPPPTFHLNVVYSTHTIQPIIWSNTSFILATYRMTRLYHVHWKWD